MYASWPNAMWALNVRRALCTMSCKVWALGRPLKSTSAIKSWSLGFSTLTVRPLVLKHPTTLLITQDDTAWLLIFFIVAFWQRQMFPSSIACKYWKVFEHFDPIAAVCCGKDALAVCPQLLLHSHATWELLFWLRLKYSFCGDRKLLFSFHL